MKAFCGERHVDTHAALLAAAIADPEDPGFADDQEDVENGVCPRSLRFDEAHLSGAGFQVAWAQVKARMVALGWV